MGLPVAFSWSSILSFPFIGFMMLLSDVFPILARFSKMTQKSAADVDLDAFFKELPLVLKVLESMKSGVRDDDHIAHADQDQRVHPHQARL